MAKAHVITYETLLDDEPNQILGITHLGDAINCGAAYVTLWSINEFITLIRWGEVRYTLSLFKMVPLGVYIFAAILSNETQRNTRVAYSSFSEICVRLYKDDY